ncbi:MULTISPECIES: PP2C family protein-serine/threonine phosphatase [unclassified Streptomyces]|jgi:serine phosphatase RsbU (regulator of sigma subunit)|uniref:PP2C family protein-serine/threonine phosphatase n=1 Tax=unclassified Streptomyces TaxID=2593676 RepID=UPI000F5024B3|nr:MULTISPECIES: PP2C family protein-serine/threonine phosphatase [unclassified Streptomyces]MDH6448664.1 serine phosphatase RsbU (regulator of sigma subunit) [Streptomyces sp. SAI-119]MDH6500755.1 serine phosphatase RsbU (regulator of sigma subunit) [Streptomyces sp. SAI-149]
MMCIKAAVPRVGSLRRVLSMGLPTVWGAVAITYKLTCPLAQQNGLGARVVTSAVFFAVGTGLIVHVRRALLRELRQAKQVAGAAQSVLLRPLPPSVDGLTVAAAQLSADRGATIGGDLYEAVATEHGVRVVMGDVRGHGLAAIGTAAAVLGSFREAVHDEPELAGVLRRLDRALARHLRERAERDGTVAEEFVTLLLLEIGRDGELHALNCGHPWPYLLSGSLVEPLSRVDPMPPLGPFPLPADLSGLRCGQLLPGESLVLHTDGAEDARDAGGRFFSLREVLRDAGETPQAVLGRVFTALLHHSGGTPKDDVALLVLKNDRQLQPTQGARGTARTATTAPRSTTYLQGNGV